MGALGIALSIVAALLVGQAEERQVQAQFERRANELGFTIEESIQTTVGVLYSLRAFVEASGSVTRQEFTHFARGALARTPAIQAVSWEPVVRHAERAAYEAAAQREMSRPLPFTERDSSGRLIPAAHRPEYVPVYYIEPATGNEGALGFDLASDVTRRAALERARDTGLPVATARVRLVQERGDQFGVLILMPIYRRGLAAETVEQRRRDLQGYASGVLRIGSLVDASLRGIDTEGIQVHVNDEAAPPHERLLHVRKSGTSRLGSDVRWLTTLDVGDRRWSLLFVATPTYLGAQRSWQPWTLFGAGLIVTGLLVGYLIVSARRTDELLRLNALNEREIADRRQAEAIAEQRRLEAEVLADIGRRISQSLDPRDVAQRIANSLHTLLASSSAAVWRLVPPSEDLVAVAVSGDLVSTPDPDVVFPAGTGAVGLSVRERRAVTTLNLLEDSRIILTPEVRLRLEQTRVRSILAIPLRIQDTIIGALGVGDRAGRAFKPEEVKLAEAFADQAAIALENARLHRRSEERAQKLTALSTVVRSITLATSGSQVFDKIAEAATTLLEARATRVWVADPERQVLESRGTFGLGRWLDRTARDLPTIPYGSGLIGHIFATGVAEYVLEIQEDSRWLNPRLAHEADLHASASVPLVPGDRAVGVLSILFGTRGHFSEEEKEIIGLLADHAAIAIANAESFTSQQTALASVEASAQALRESEQRTRLIIATSLDAVITMNARGTITGWNPQAEKIFGWSEQEALGRNLAETIIPRRDREAYERALQRFLATGEGPMLNKRLEVLALHRDGVELPVELTVAAARSADMVLFSAFVRDLTDRKRAERRQAAQFAVTRVLADAKTLSEGASGLLEAICGGAGWELGELWTVDHDDSTVLRWGGEWHVPTVEADEFTSTSRAMVLAPGQGLAGRVWSTGQPAWSVEAARDVEPARAEIASRLGLRAAFAFPVRGATDVTAVLAFFSSAARAPETEILAVMEDIGSRIGQFIEQKRAEDGVRRIERHVQQLQRLEAVGRLAGGVAHDFNNLVTVITGRTQILLRRLPLTDRTRGDLELIGQTAERAASLTRQLLAFGRKQILAPKILDLNAVVSGMTTLLRRLIGEDIELGFRPTTSLGRVKADPGQLEQVIVNLIINARDAMPDGGLITVETANTDLGAAYAHQHVGVTPGPYVLLAISDTGIGMDAETQARIFEPFFTTKEPGKGTGLGLSTVYGIVKQSGGNVWVYSEPGRGTTFKVYLPRVEDIADVEEPRRPAPQRGTETILLVEDDDEVRALVRDILASYGYEVLSAANPLEAFSVAERHTGPIHLLVTDVVMPQMSGRALAERLGALRPGIAALYISGYADKAIVDHGILQAGTPFLAKPFTPDALARSVREVLDRSPRY
jgi:PAS domain S-box-containing protein